MWRGTALVLLVVASPAAAQVLRFERSEPHLVEGVEQMRSGDYDGATSSFERAQTENKEHRAIVQYNVGNAQLEKAQAIQEAQGQAPAAEGDEDPAQTLLSAAADSFNQAYELSSDPKVRSDAALGLGNTKVAAQDIEGAISAYRRALVANPQNGPARNNLLSALRLMQQQPPQQSGGGQGDKDDKDKEGEEGEQQKGDQGDQQEQDPQDEGEQGEQGEQDDGQGDKDQSDGAQDDKKNPADEQGKGGDEDQKKPDQEKDERSQQGQDEDPQDKKQDQAGGGAGDEKAPADKDPRPGQPQGQPQDKRDLDKEEAKRLLDALRKNERPLLPYQMRSQHQRLAPLEKTW